MLGRRGWIIDKHKATLGPMRIDGKDHPLHDVAARCECLRETHAYLARGAWSRQPTLVDALPRLDRTSAGIQDSPKDFDATEIPLDGFIKPEPYLAGGLGDHYPVGRHRAYQSSMGCQEPWICHEQAEQYKPPCQERRQQPVGLTAGGLKHHGVYLILEDRFRPLLSAL